MYEGKSDNGPMCAGKRPELLGIIDDFSIQLNMMDELLDAINSKLQSVMQYSEPSEPGPTKCETKTPTPPSAVEELRGMVYRFSRKNAFLEEKLRHIQQIV